MNARSQPQPDLRPDETGAHSRVMHVQVYEHRHTWPVQVLSYERKGAQETALTGQNILTTSSREDLLLLAASSARQTTGPRRSSIPHPSLCICELQCDDVAGDQVPYSCAHLSYVNHSRSLGRLKALPMIGHRFGPGGRGSARRLEFNSQAAATRHPRRAQSETTC